MRLDPGFRHTRGETPESFVSRLARLNGVPSGRALCKDLGIAYDGLVSGHAYPVTRLCELTDTDPASLNREARHREGGRYLVRGQSLVVSSFVGAHVRVCPECLAEDARTCTAGTPAFLPAFGRTAWTITHIRTCPLHDAVLVDLPAQPKRTVQDFASVVGPWLEGGDDALRVVRRRLASAFETYLCGRLEGRSDNRWLDGIPFHAAAKACEMIGAVATFGRTLRLSTLTSDQTAAVGATGFALMSGGPDALDSYLGDLIASYGGDRATPVGPAAWFGDLYEWLAYRNDDPAFDDLRDAMVRSVARHAGFNPNDRMFGKPIPNRQVHSVRSAAVLLSVSGQRLRKALDHAGHLPAGHETLPDHEVLFDALKAERLLNSIASAMTLTAVGKRLGIDWRLASDLVTAGHLRSIPSSDMGTVSPWFDPADVNGFLEAVLSRAELVQAAPEGALDVAQGAFRARCHLTDVIDLIVGGRLGWVGFLQGAVGLRTVLVDVDELRASVRGEELRGYTRHQVERTLGISSAAVNILVERGFLSVTTQRHPSVPRDVFVIAREDVDRFRARYARITDVSETLGIPSRSVLGLLGARGIKPALTKAEFDATFYEWAAVELIRR